MYRATVRTGLLRVQYGMVRFTMLYVPAHLYIFSLYCNGIQGAQIIRKTLVDSRFPFEVWDPKNQVLLETLDFKGPKDYSI